MACSEEDIKAVITSLGWTFESCLLVTDEDTETPDLEGSIGVFSFTDVPKETRVDLGILVEPDAGNDLKRLSPLLSALRDVHCQRVLICLAGEDWSRSNLLSLGFVPTSIRGWYVHDPDTFNRPREWNNPDHWANPENFEKYRW